jgi:hypothetical protein
MYSFDPDIVTVSVQNRRKTLSFVIKRADDHAYSTFAAGSALAIVEDD